MEPIQLTDAVVVCLSFDEAERLPIAPAEQRLVEGAPSALRARELRAGRAAARVVLSALGGEPPAVLADPEGRPRLEPGDPARHVSIAHDAGWVVAAAAREPVGVDALALDRAEQAERVVRRRIEKGARPLETDAPLWPASMLLWTGWEALGKRTGGGVLSGVMSLPIAPRVEGEWLVAEVEDVRLRWFELRGLLVCVATCARRAFSPGAS